MEITKNKLEKAILDVKYEINMLIYTFELLKKTNNDQMAENILLESFAIHAYNLYFFFYTHKRHKDDILAIDYINKKGEYRRNRTKKRVFGSIKTKRNKQLAHLTFTRLNYNKRTKPWKTKVIYEGLTKTIKAFHNSLSDEMKAKFINTK